ncbi:tetratricopeptide repeat protein, partial [bacterium]|nr:tetratricopeptide repeat protein [bacterium]
LGTWLWRRSPRERLAGFGIFWFYIALSVESSLIPLQMVITEYRVYLPFAGLIITMVSGSLIVMERTGINNKTIGYTAITIIALLSIATFERNSVWETKLSLWQDAASKNRTSSRPLLHVGNVYEKLNELDKALKPYAQAVNLDPDNFMTHYNVGVIYYYMGKYRVAEKEFMETIRLKPSYAKAYNNLGSIYLQEKRYDLAEKALLKVLKLNPLNENAYSNIILTLLNQNRYRDAERYLKAQAKHFGTDADQLNKLGICYEETGRGELARETLKQGITLFPTNHLLLFNLASLEQDAGRYKEAETLYKETIKHMPEDFSAPYHGLTILYLNTGRNKEALTVAQKALRQNPSSQKA